MVDAQALGSRIGNPLVAAQLTAAVDEDWGEHLADTAAIAQLAAPEREGGKFKATGRPG
ncbi:MAG: hypothetical protein AAF609_21700 [Cyanobacteria bacterium P01_C01_bin.120]